MEAYINKVISDEANAILNIPISQDYKKCVDLIYERVHVLKGKLVASGMGKAGQIALNIATTLSSTGTPSVFLHPSDSQHGDLGVIQENDILLLVSNSGRTREIVELVELAGHLHKGLPLIVITGNPDSELAHHADACLYTGAPAEVCPLGLTPSTSTTVMTVIGDILMVLMMKKIGFTSEAYAKRHHGGYLGDKSREKAKGERPSARRKAKVTSDKLQGEKAKEMRILREETAAIVIDIQERLMPAMAESEAFLKNAVLMVSGLQVLNIPMIVTQQYTQGLGATVHEISAYFEDFSFMEKRAFSCCGADDVMQRLSGLKARNIILFGIESHVCVLQTALDLKEAEYNPVVVMDAVTSRYPANKMLAMERFRQEGILMTSTESLLFELTRSSTAPEFRAISKLVK